MSIETRLIKLIESLPDGEERQKAKRELDDIIVLRRDNKNLLDENERLNIDLIVAKAND